MTVELDDEEVAVAVPVAIDLQRMKVGKAYFSSMNQEHRCFIMLCIYIYTYLISNQ